MQLTDESPMPFGKHKNTKMANVPANYLIWLYDQLTGMEPFGEASQAVRDYTVENLEALRQEIENLEMLKGFGKY